jgi:serine/threonine protein phosphatase PrpC
VVELRAAVDATCLDRCPRGDGLCGIVANVGDSRAIIASQLGERLLYSPLSNDQTPFRRDERERIKRKVSNE